jgi:hypothetical protein
MFVLGGQVALAQDRRNQSPHDIIRRRSIRSPKAAEVAVCWIPDSLCCARIAGRQRSAEREKSDSTNDGSRDCAARIIVCETTACNLVSVAERASWPDSRLSLRESGDGIQATFAERKATGDSPQQKQLTAANRLWTVRSRCPSLGHSFRCRSKANSCCQSSANSHCRPRERNRCLSTACCSWLVCHS